MRNTADISINELKFICKRQDTLKSACNISPVNVSGMLATAMLGLVADAVASSLSRSKESSPRQVIGCCLHCRWPAPPPRLTHLWCSLEPRSSALHRTIKAALSDGSSQNYGLTHQINTTFGRDLMYKPNKSTGNNVLRLNVSTFRKATFMQLFNESKKKTKACLSLSSGTVKRGKENKR